MFQPKREAGLRGADISQKQMSSARLLAAVAAAKSQIATTNYAAIYRSRYT
jgi:hypothetical protein